MAAAICAATVFGYVGVEMIRIHPYQNAYLNEVTNALLPGNAEDMFEVEYWLQSYKEGAEWLDAHVEPEAEVYVAFQTNCADPYLNRKSRLLDEATLPVFEDRTRSRYLMLVTRKAMYKEAIAAVVRAYEPVFTVRRQKGTLLRVYCNRQLKADPALEKRPFS